MMEEELITEYFNRGYKYKEILAVLRISHGITRSLRQLQRKLNELGLRRNGEQSPSIEVISFIENQVKSSGSSLGYRMMHQLCKQNRLKVNRRNVALIQTYLDPHGVQLRKRNRLRRRQYFSRGPNFVWHVDGYDKLKPYGFPIHGGIDGFSRFILWLNLCSSNKDPKIVSNYYLNHVKNIGGAPRKVVADRGTENIYIAAAHRFFRQSEDSFVYGRSISNQRIESWWSMLRRSCTNWWINFFRDLVESRIYDLTSNLHVECAKFCFGKIIQNDLDKIRNTWNNHRIRRSQNTTNQFRPSGIPSLIYTTPNILGNDVNDYKNQVLEIEIDAVEEICCSPLETRFFCSENFYTLASILMSENNFRYPTSPDEALHLFINLTNIL